MRLSSPFAWLITIAWVGAVLPTQRAANDLGAADYSSKRAGTDHYGDPLPENALARIGSPRLRDSSPITSVVFSRDGKSLFTCASGSEIACWETATGMLQRRIPCPQHGAFCLALSPDGKTLAAVSCGRNDIWLIDAATGKTLRQFGEKIDGVTHIAAAFSPDGATLASCGCGGVLLWDVKTGALRCRFSMWGACWGMAWSRDGKLLAGVGESSGHLGDVASGKERWSIALGRQNGRCSVAFAPDGSIVAFDDEDGNIRLVAPNSGKELRRFNGHKGPATALAFTPDGMHLVIGGQDATIRIWDLAAAKEKLRFELGPSGRFSVWKIACAPDGKTLASVDDQTVRLWSMATGKELLPLSGHREFVTALAFAPDGRSLASGDFGGSLLLTDPVGLKAQPAPAGHAQPINAVVFAPDGKTLASGCWGGKVILWDRSTGKERLSCKGHLDRIYALAFSPDGKKLASASIDSTVRLWDAATGKEIRRMEGGATWKWVTALAFSADGRLIASAREDGTVRLCEVASGKEIRKLEGHQGRVTSIASSSDGHLVSGGEDRTVRVWEWSSGKEVRCLKGAEGEVNSVDFAPDGRTVVAGDEDAAVLIWELASEQLIGRFRGHQEIVYSVAFAPDGRSVASGSRDFTILLWDVTGQSGAPATKVAAATAAELWERLAAPDAGQAHQTLWRMVRTPAISVPMLRKAMRPVEPPTKEQIGRLVADLDADRFAVREKAFAELKMLGEFAALALRKALAERPTPELEQRAERLLKLILAQKTQPFRLRLGRALSVLEQIGTRDAREALDSLAKGPEGAWLTNESRASVQRLDARAKKLAAIKAPEN